MKKTIKVLLILTVLLATMFAITGCGKKDNKNEEANKNEIVGVWKSPLGDYTYQFNEDGTGFYNVSGIEMKFTYKTNSNRLSLTYEGNTNPFETDFSINGDTLNVKDSYGNDTLYKKQ